MDWLFVFCRLAGTAGREAREGDGAANNCAFGGSRLDLDAGAQELGAVFHRAKAYAIGELRLSRKRDPGVLNGNDEFFSSFGQRDPNPLRLAMLEGVVNR